MSTFRGILPEFPDIRIDFFRSAPDLRPPRVCFLSHVHSDHLLGLETPSFHTCFIYCSAATREILLRLEKYPQRLSFHQGILEKPPKVTYKHLDKLLKAIPLETPTRIELEPGNNIQVTLFNANHCIGAVMFLIEGDNKAILYTGDIRSEPWFVNNLTRNPFLIEYTCGLKTLDCIYLDTSNTAKIPFPTKSDGLKELLQKVSKYPVDTVFHFAAWTFGYEEVWMALSHALKSQIHVDEYKMRLYESLRGRPHDPKDPTNGTYLSSPFLAQEGPALAGYRCGNSSQPGCLTSDPTADVSIHSCEKGLHCDKINDKIVWIRPIVARTNHGEIAEAGIGGGGDDLSRHLDLVLDTKDAIDEFLELFANTEELVKMDIKRMLSKDLRSQGTVISLDDINLDPKQGDISLTKIKEALTRSVVEKKSALLSEILANKEQAEALPRVITFPYSRHSSYAELRHLVKVFSPKDVYPCTVDEANWDEEVSMENLFGQECSATEFRHDNKMRELHAVSQLHHEALQSQTTATSASSSPKPIPTADDRTNNEPRTVDDVKPGDLQLLTGTPKLAGSWRAENGRIYNDGSAQTIPRRRRSCTSPPFDVPRSHEASEGSRPRFEGLVVSSQSLPPSSPVRRNAMLPPSSPVHAKPCTSKVYSVRSLDADGNEKLPSAEQRQKLTEMDNVSHLTSHDRYRKRLDEMMTGVDATPPKDIIAVSPGSASQNLRRKAIHEGLEGQVKRIRLSYDGPASSPSAVDSSVTTQQKGNNFSAAIVITDESDDADGPALSSNTDRVFESVEHTPIPNASSTNQTTNGEEVQAVGDPYERQFAGIFYDESDDTYVEHDSEDGSIVTRCKDCGHEMWTVWMTSIGFCTHCDVDAGPEDSDYLPYYEIIDPGGGPRPEIDFGCFAEGYLPSLEHEARRKNIVGDYIDDHSDAYDTFDEEDGYVSAYDSADSFIDDVSIHSTRDEAQDELASNGDSGAYYQEMFMQLQRKHNRLQDRYEGMMRDFVDSDYEYDSSSSEEAYDSDWDEALGEVDELGALIVEVIPPDPVVAELVLSQAQEQSQVSEVSPDRISERVRAFEAAAGERWNDISLVSAGGNHTEVEVEL